MLNSVDDNPVFDAARVFLDGECQNLVYCCDPKCAEKPTFKRFFRQGSQSSRKNQVFKTVLFLYFSFITNLVVLFRKKKQKEQMISLFLFIDFFY